MSETTRTTELAELRSLVEKLFGRIDNLERELAHLREIPHEDLIAISAAVSAYLGYKAKVRRIRFHTGHSWAQSGLDVTHNRSVPRHR